MQIHRCFCLGNPVALPVLPGLPPRLCIWFCLGLSGFNGTFLNSPSTSMIFLYSTGGSTLCWSDCSHRKCTFLWPGAKPFSVFLASCWLPKMDMTPKVTSTLRQRYAECKATLKVFKRPLPKMALYGYGMSATSNVMYLVRGFWGAEGYRECDDPDWFNSFPAEASMASMVP
jgi:hypothetical protein